MGVFLGEKEDPVTDLYDVWRPSFCVDRFDFMFEQLQVSSY